MSASRKKKERKAQSAEAPVAQGQPVKKGMSRGLKTTLIVVCAIVVIAAVVFFSMVTGGYFASHTTAATVGSHNLTPAMVNYFYNAQVYEFKKSYGSYLGIDAASLSTQVYNEETGATWADLLMEQALNTAAQTYAIYDEAIANGAALSEDDQSQIDTILSSYELTAAQQGYANVNAYLASGYGAGCNTKSYTEYLTVTMIAENYCQQVNDGFTYTAEDLAAEYEAKPANYSTYTYRQFLISDSLFQTDDNALSDEELAEKKEALATEMAASTQGDEQAFIDAAYENASESSKDSYADESYTLRSYTGSSIVEAQRDWLADSARQEGDTTAIDVDGTWYVLYYISCDVNDWQLPNVREIPFAATDASDEDAMNEAKANAEAALAEYEAGEQTAEAFAALVQKYTSDETATGLTENVTPGSGSDEYNAWAFDAARQTGDTAVVETSTGYSVLFFDSYGSVYRDTLIETSLRNTAYSDWYTGLTGNASYTEQSFGMRFTSK